MYLKAERWIIKSSQHVSLSKKWWMNTASFPCRLQEAEISVTDEKPLEPGVLRMWKINYKNVNSIKPFKTEEQRDMSQRKVVRTLTTLSVVFFVITTTSAGFHSASSICTAGLMTMPVQHEYCFFPLHISTTLPFLEMGSTMIWWYSDFTSWFFY